MSLLSTVLATAADFFIWGAVEPDHRYARSAVLIDGHWEEGTLYLGDKKVVWDKRIVFSPDQGRLVDITDDDEAWTIAPNMVVLHYLRDDELIKLAVFPEDVENITRVLPLPA